MRFRLPNAVLVGLALAAAAVLAGAQALPGVPNGPAEPAPAAKQAAGQNPAQPAAQNRKHPQYVFRAQSAEVLVHVTVLDKKGRPVNNLPLADFRVFDNGAQQHVDYFTHSDAPISAGLVVDNSGSMEDKRTAVIAAALDFVRASNPQDQIFIVNFNDEYYLDTDFTSSIAKLQQGLDHIQSTGGTALYDAIVASLYHLKKGTRQKKVLLVITDGSDDASQDTLEQVVRTAQQMHGPLIYCVGLTYQDMDRGRADRALKRIARATGGMAYFPKDLSQVNSITEYVAAAIRRQYTLGYRPNQKQPGFHAIRVELRGKHTRGLRIYARTGYYEAGSPGGGS